MKFIVVTHLIQSSNITSNNQINTTAPIQENRNSTLPPISENLPQNITTSVNSQNWAATSTITQQPQAATSPSSTTGTPAPAEKNAGNQHQDTQRLHLSHSQHLPAKPMTYAC
ncbi:unnamed protein product [[Candida] boidinii]|nr:unnamed protein product [[Candida] boidinii]